MEVSFSGGETLKKGNVKVKDSRLYLFLFLFLIYFSYFGLRVRDYCDIMHDCHKMLQNVTLYHISIMVIVT